MGPQRTGMTAQVEKSLMHKHEDQSMYSQRSDQSWSSRVQMEPHPAGAKEGSSMSAAAQQVQGSMSSWFS